MALKPTRRRNGKFMVNIRVTAVLSRSDVVSIIAHRAVIFGRDEESLTKAGVEALIRDEVADYGSNFGIHAMDALRDSDEGDELTEWADAEMTRLYPTWTD